MLAWTKTMTRPTKTNMVFASMLFIALLLVAWSRTDFSSPSTTPTATPKEDNALYAPLDVRLGPNLTELAPIEPEFSDGSASSNNKTIPSSVTVEPRKQPSWQPVIVPAVQKVLDVISPVLSVPTTLNITTPDEPIVEITAPSDCPALLGAEVCV